MAHVVELDQAEGMLHALDALRASAAAADAESARLLTQPTQRAEALGNLARHVDTYAAQVIGAVDRLVRK